MYVSALLEEHLIKQFMTVSALSPSDTGIILRRLMHDDEYRINYYSKVLARLVMTLCNC